MYVIFSVYIDHNWPVMLKLHVKIITQDSKGLIFIYIN